MYESSWISMRFGGSAPSRSLPKYLRSDMERCSVNWLLLVAFAPPPDWGARVKLFFIVPTGPGR